MNLPGRGQFIRSGIALNLLDFRSHFWTVFPFFGCTSAQIPLKAKFLIVSINILTSVSLLKVVVPGAVNYLYAQ